jgi:regulator of replication initiation timing
MFRVTDCNGDITVFKKKVDIAKHIASFGGVTFDSAQSMLSREMKGGGSACVGGCMVEIVNTEISGTVDRLHSVALMSSLDTIKYNVNLMSNSYKEFDPKETLLSCGVLPDIAEIIKINLTSGGDFSMVADYKVRLFSKKLVSVSIVGGKLAIHLPALTDQCVPQGYYIKVDKKHVENPSLVNAVVLDYIPQGNGTANQLTIQLANYDKFSKDGRSNQLVELTEPIIIDEVDTVGVFNAINAEMGSVRKDVERLSTEVCNLKVTNKNLRDRISDQDSRIASTMSRVTDLKIDNKKLSDKIVELEKRIAVMNPELDAFKELFKNLVDGMEKEDADKLRAEYAKILEEKKKPF